MASFGRPTRRLWRVAAVADAIVAFGTILACLSPPSAGAAVDPCAGQSIPLSSVSSVSQPACWRPFTATSPMNTPLPANPALAADSGAVVAHMSAYGWTFGASTTGFSIDGGGSRPVYFASAADPMMTINCTDEEGPGTCQALNGVDINGARIHVPSGATPSANADAHMTIIETDTGEEYDLWHARVSGATITAGTGGVENVNTSEGTGDAGDAASFALSAGLLRPAELASGHIDHALVIDIPCTDATGRDIGYSWPAVGGWGEACGRFWNESPQGAPTIGQLFRLDMTDSQIAASGAPVWQQTIMTALAHYGAYAEDTNGTWQHQQITIFTQAPISWTSLGQPDQWSATVNALGGHADILSSPIPIPTSRLETVDPCVPQGTCPNLTGPAPPPDPAIAPIATPSAPAPPSVAAPSAAGTAVRATVPTSARATSRRADAREHRASHHRIRHRFGHRHRFRHRHRHGFRRLRAHPCARTVREHACRGSRPRLSLPGSGPRSASASIATRPPAGLR